MTARPLLVAGPCALESEDLALRVAEAMAATAARHGLRFVFKASFDKANRTSRDGFRGPGVAEGLAILDRVRRELGVTLLTDVHEPGQASTAAEVADVLQVPALLCRQTDLLEAVGRTGRTANLKKGPFLTPWQAPAAAAKLREAGAPEVWITERGTTFGHGDLVVDFRGLVDLRAAGATLLFDASHAAQQPGAHGDRSGGRRAWIPVLAGAAAGAGFDGLYLEVHPDPDSALSDAETQWPLQDADRLIGRFVRLWEAAR